MIPMPDFSVGGFVGFMGAALGITIGEALFTAPMSMLEKGISKRS